MVRKISIVCGAGAFNTLRNRLACRHNAPPCPLWDATTTVRDNPVLRAGSFVGVYSGRKATDKDDGDYLLHLPKGAGAVNIDAGRAGALMRFVNGSAGTRANVRFAPLQSMPAPFGTRSAANWPQVPVFAVRDICAHEELLADYGPEFELPRT